MPVVFVDGNNWYHALKRAVDVALAVDMVRMADRNVPLKKDG